MKLKKKKKLQLLKNKKKNLDISMDLYYGEEDFLDFMADMEDLVMEDSDMDYGDIECFY